MILPFLAVAVLGDVVRFRPVDSGLLDFITPTKNLLIEPSEQRPAGVRVAPKTAAPRYGSFRFGSVDYFVIVDGNAGEKSRIFIDSNHDGNLTNDGQARGVREIAFFDNERKFQTRGTASIMMPTSSGERRVPIEVYDFPANKEGKRQVAVRIGYGTRGRVDIGGETYDAALVDTAMSGDFSKPGADPFGVWLRVDLNRNGRFERRGERFFTGKPFALNGRTYEAKVLSPDGTRLRLDLSDQHALEVPPPPALRKDELLEPFTAKTADGRTIRFPEDFRDKVVLLDFGTAWRSAWEDALPAMGRLRNELGIEVIEIALDQPSHQQQLNETLKAAKVDWPVVYQPKGWQDELPQKYGIVWAPTRIVVDGSTRRLLVDSSQLENERLISEVARAVGKPVSADLRHALDIKVPSDVKDVPLFLELARRYEVDQAGRQLADLGQFADFLFDRLTAVDHDNTEFMKRLLREGWPGISRVGKAGSNYAWIFVQHADNDKPFQMRALEIMKPAVDRGEASGGNYAYLVDRVLTGQGKKQIYGSQLSIVDGVIDVLPMEDPEHVDERRKSVGLGTLRAYLEYGAKLWGYKIKGDK